MIGIVTRLPIRVATAKIPVAVVGSTQRISVEALARSAAAGIPQGRRVILVIENARLVATANTKGSTVMLTLKPLHKLPAAMAHLDELLDEALKATFPASDPVAIDVELESPEQELTTISRPQSRMQGSPDDEALATLVELASSAATRAVKASRKR
jgi:hypothetical protein